MDVSQPMEPVEPPVLSDEEGRVIGCLIEKQMTTPEQYPMTLHGLTLAANQKSNRHPVVDYAEALVERTLRDLTDAGLGRMVHRPGDRVVKYKHALDEYVVIDESQLALLAVLLLRGAQTPGELRQRTQRYVEFDTLAHLDGSLERLVERGLVRRLGRRPGQKESRYVDQISTRGVVTTSDGHQTSYDSIPSERQVVPGGFHGLGDQLDELRDRFERLLKHLGVDDL